MGEQLLCEQKPGPRPGLNAIGRYALAVKKDLCVFVGQIVSHHPKIIAEATQRGSEIAISRSYRTPTIFLRSQAGQTERTAHNRPVPA